MSIERHKNPPSNSQKKKGRRDPAHDGAGAALTEWLFPKNTKHPTPNLPFPQNPLNPGKADSHENPAWNGRETASDGALLLPESFPNSLEFYFSRFPSKYNQECCTGSVADDLRSGWGPRHIPGASQGINRLLLTFPIPLFGLFPDYGGSVSPFFSPSQTQNPRSRRRGRRPRSSRSFSKG